MPPLVAALGLGAPAPELRTVEFIAERLTTGQPIAERPTAERPSAAEWRSVPAPLLSALPLQARTERMATRPAAMRRIRPATRTAVEISRAVGNPSAMPARRLRARAEHSFDFQTAEQIANAPPPLFFCKARGAPSVRPPRNRSEGMERREAIPHGLRLARVQL